MLSPTSIFDIQCFYCKWSWNYVDDDDFFNKHKYIHVRIPTQMYGITYYCKDLEDCPHNLGSNWLRIQLKKWFIKEQMG